MLPGAVHPPRLLLLFHRCTGGTDTGAAWHPWSLQDSECLYGPKHGGRDTGLCARLKGAALGEPDPACPTAALGKGSWARLLFSEGKTPSRHLHGAVKGWGSPAQPLPQA